MSANLEIQWVHSTIGCPPDQRGTIKGLGFRRLNEKRTVVDTPQTRGMINKVSHLVVIVGTHKKTQSKRKKVTHESK